MKLYNRTKIDNQVLENILVLAARSMGARSSNVVVFVNRGVYRTKGAAQYCNWIKPSKREYRVSTDGGYFQFAIPFRLVELSLRGRWSQDAIDIARGILWTMRHEWGHIRDYQQGGPFTLAWSEKGQGGRRPAHDSRPEEIRVQDYMDESDKTHRNGYFDNAVLDLAIELERVANGG